MLLHCVKLFLTRNLNDQVTVAPTGEYLISAAGEVHLQKCLEDMTKYFAPDVELHISTFVVPFRETVTRSSPDNGETLTSAATDSHSRALKQMESILQRLEQQVGTQSNLIHESGSEKPSTDVNPLPEESVPVERVVTFETSDVPKPQTKLMVTEVGSHKRSARHTLPVDADLPDCPVGYFQLPHSKSRTRVLIHVSAHPMPVRLLQWVSERGSRKIPQLIRAFKTKVSDTVSAVLHVLCLSYYCSSH